MPIIRIVQPPMVTPELYDAVNAEMGVDSEPPPGLLMHCAGVVDGTFQIVDVWESAEQARRFDEQRLGPAITTVMGQAPAGPPPTTTYELHSLIQP